ncbi:sensor histidine kinase, partial [Enterocloster asparagiformis]
TDLKTDRILAPILKSIQDKKATTFVSAERQDPLYSLLKGHTIIAAPLIEHNEPIGSLTIMVKKQWHTSEANVSFADELARLFSTQLELSDLEYQKKLRRKAELRALQSQVNPHFLYNALNTISYVCRENPNRARELILTLSSYYRQTLENDRYMLSLHTELYHVNSYLELEKARFEEKLSVEIHVDENLDCMVPSFILQPLVENAVRYGADKSGSRFVSIRAVRRGGLAEISVSDHGPGIPPTVLENLQSGAGNEGVGLENVHRRLKSIYGEENGLQAVNTPEGACVYFTVPAEGLPKYDAV